MSDTTHSEHYDPTRTNVTFATLSAGSPTLDHMRSVLAVDSPRSLGESYNVLAVVNASSGPYLDMGRNQLVESIIGNEITRDSDWFVFLDDDIVFTPEAARALLDGATKYATRLASGPYACNDPYFGASICAYSLTHYDPDVHPAQIERNRLSDGRFFHPIPINACPESPVPIDAFGAGFMAVHTSLIAEMGAAYKNPQRWFAELVLDGFGLGEGEGMWLGEDLIFCLRAANFTTPYLIPDARVQHQKRQTLIVPEPSVAYPFTRD